MKIEKPIEQFSIKGLLWVRFKRDINISIPELDKEIHITFSNHPNTNLANLHISKNASGVDSKCKPSIRILEIEKQHIEDVSNIIVRALLNVYLKPVDIKFLKKKYPEIVFLDTSRIKKNKVVFTNFNRQISRLYSKKKQKVTLEVDDLNEQEFFNRLIETGIYKYFKISGRYLKHAHQAFYTTESQTLTFIKVKKKWYQISKSISLIDLVEKVFGKALARQIIYKFIASYKRLKKANTYSEVEKFNKPILIFPKKKS